MTPSLAGLVALFTPQAIVFMMIGVIYGLVIGISRAGGVVAMALLLPFTYGFETAATIALLLGAHIATHLGRLGHQHPVQRAGLGQGSLRCVLTDIR